MSLPRLAQLIDDRTSEEQIRDLGVEVVTKEAVKLNITGVKWLNQKKSPLKLDPRMISLGKASLILGDKVLDWIGSDKILLGVGKSDDATVMLIKPSPKGSKISKTKTGSARVGSKQLLDSLKKEGAIEGRYDVIKRKGDTVLIAIPLEADEDDS